MDPITQQTTLASAGGKKDPLYVDDVFSTFLYDGTGSAQTITNGIDLSGEGGLVWSKSRTTSNRHCLIDTERGVGKVLFADDSLSADTDNTTITSFNSNGYSMGTSTFKINVNNADLVSWTFRKCPKFFDIVEYTGSGIASENAFRYLAHSLESTPGMIIVKRTDSVGPWVVGHVDKKYPYYLKLNTADGAAGGTASATPGYVGWSGSDNFYISNGGSSTAGNDLNIQNATYVAYIFANDDQSFGDAGNESIIKCGSISYTGGTPLNVNLGWEAQWVLVKKSDGAEQWFLVDTMRGMIDGDGAYLQANTTNTEGAYGIAGATSTGFIFDPGTNIFGSGDFIYMAIRRPHKPPSAGTEVFKPELLTSLTQTSTPGFAPDLVLQRPERSSTNTFFVGSRLTGNGAYLQTAANSAEGSFTSWKFDAPTGKFTQSLTTGSTSGGIQHFFKRAPGALDVVAYTGQGGDNSVASNLGVAPEMIWVKNRSSSSANWAVYHASAGITKEGALNTNAAFVTGTMGGYGSGSIWYTNPHPSGVFYVSNDVRVNASGDNYIAYLFATLPGISKVGSYAGTGNNINVDCGFTNGARFILIKAVDRSGSWWVFDSARGISNGNDPALYLNSTSAEYNSDRIAPLSSGFTVGTGDFELNKSGNNYIFLAIA